jgi:two-component system phosphate regulon sensor histidine kinase PhoR
MRRRPLLWHWLPATWLLTLVVLALAAAWACHAVRRFDLQQASRELGDEARRVRMLIEPLVEPTASAAADSLCRALAQGTSLRISVVLASGRVVVDTGEELARLEMHRTPDRTEILAALRGETGQSLRYSRTLRRTMLYVAVPIWRLRDNTPEVIGAVRTALPLSEIQRVLSAVYRRILAGAAVLALLAGLAQALIARRLARGIVPPLRELEDAVGAWERGAPHPPPPGSGPREVEELAEATHRMIRDVDLRLRAVTDERNELEAILLGMMEGVLAVDDAGRVVRMNRACARMLGVEAARVEGRTLEETLRLPALQQFVARVAQRREPIEGEVVAHGREERLLEARGAPWRNAAGQDAGVVLVLHDVTRLRRLETVRRDFVANVSHELRTPITAIRGAAEALAEGPAATDPGATSFLRMILRQSERLNSVIEDLLRLSGIERQAEREELVLEDAPLAPVLYNATQACAARAAEKGIEVAVSCPAELRARIDPELLENAVVNLVDNAIKYSGAGSSVRVSAAAEDGAVAIAVRDDGCGIEPRHQERIFERFYRVDPARSREAGGTGLGLAIVKHIAQAHGGRVTVESAPGQGSTFRILLPAS